MSAFTPDFFVNVGDQLEMKKRMLAAFMARTSPAELVAELSGLGDAVVLDTRVLMAARAGSADATTWPAEEDRLGFFGPDSVTWRIHTDPSYAVGGLRALMLQALHPVAMDGVARNSAGFKDEWWMRMTRTGQYMETITFGSRTEARRMAARMR